MITFLFAIASVIILTPIMMFLPFGFSKKLRLGISGSAFLLANVGLLAVIQFSLYQTILILVLLIGLISLLLEKRIGNSKQSEIVPKEKVFKMVPLEKEILHTDQEKLKVTIEVDSPVPSLVDEVAATVELVQAEQDVPAKIENFHVQEKEREAKVQTVEQKIIEHEIIEDSLDIDEDVSFLTNRAISLEEVEQTNPMIEQMENNPENAYMSEIEKLIESNDILEDSYEVIDKIEDSLLQVEMEELEEIIPTEFIPKVENNNKEQDFMDEIEIEELVFDK
ncbi:hypothetical protein [Bacillus sp. S/N-304-OC-R1]|uniref:hypothetical protein n=1 Tax=Bacillus sp. S/N-304-OC-R1 TaxID=2758034 RepID=UPI001C8D8F85|nr:hypothetical protein [Bacillus sp. S/N-304-OC-R1]MBY0123968.1 hypothetical protein [Bacillus sp. S/N-304-OC-R1]